MATTDVEKLLVTLEARMTQYTRELERARRSTDQTAGRIEQRFNRMNSEMNQGTGAALRRMSDQFATFGRSLLAGVAGSAITQFANRVREIVGSVAEIGLTAERLGIGAEAFQGLQIAAEQSRVTVDALADGLKEMQLRGDEFATTGGGSAAEAFQRIGMNAADVTQALQDPAEMFLTIIGRIEDLDRAAQIRVMDELFGGTGGEQFLQLLDDGEAGLRDIIARAQDAGRIMDEEMVQRAEDLDRRFNEIAGTISDRVQAAVVGVADALVTWGDNIDAALDRAANHPIWTRLMELMNIPQPGAGEIGIIQPGGGVRMVDAATGEATAGQLNEDLAEVEGRIRAVQSLIERPGLNPAMLTSLGQELSELQAQADGLRASIAALTAAPSAAPVNPWGQPAGSRPASPAATTPPATPAAGVPVPPTRPNLLDIDMRPLSERTGGGGGGGSSFVADTREQRDAVAELISELEEEMSLIGASETEQRIAAELRRAGADATQEQRKAIANLVTQMAAEEERLGAIEEAARKTEEAFADAKGTLAEFGKGLAHDLLNGVKPADALANALGRLEDKLLDLAFDNIFSGGGGKGGGFLSALINGVVGLFGGGRAPLTFHSLPGMATGGAVGPTVARPQPVPLH